MSTEILDFDTALTRKILAERAEAQAKIDRERRARADIAERIDSARTYDNSTGNWFGFNPHG